LACWRGIVVRQTVAGLGRELVAVILTVVRSGGFAGLVTRGQLDTDTAEDGGRVEEAVRRLDPGQVGTGRPQPDRYVYSLQVRPAPESDPTEITVAEQDLDGELAWVVDRVLRRE